MASDWWDAKGSRDAVRSLYATELVVKVRAQSVKRSEWRRVIDVAGWPAVLGSTDVCMGAPKELLRAVRDRARPCERAVTAANALQ